jgi:hypothetical protein
LIMSAIPRSTGVGCRKRGSHRLVRFGHAANAGSIESAISGCVTGLQSPPQAEPGCHPFASSFPGVGCPEHFEEAFDRVVLSRVNVVRGEVHQVVTDLDYLIKAADEVLPVHALAELGPVLLGAHQVPVVAQREVSGLGDALAPVFLYRISKFGRRVHLVGT